MATRRLGGAGALPMRMLYVRFFMSIYYQPYICIYCSSRRRHALAQCTDRGRHGPARLRYMRLCDAVRFWPHAYTLGLARLLPYTSCVRQNRYPSQNTAIQSERNDGSCRAVTNVSGVFETAKHCHLAHPPCYPRPWS